MKETDFCPVCKYYLYLKQSDNEETKESELRRTCRNCGYDTDDVNGLIIEFDLK